VSNDFEQQGSVAADADRQTREQLANFERWSMYLRLPALTYEELMIPIRVAFPHSVMEDVFATFMDVLVDVFEFAWLMKTVRVQWQAEAARLADVGKEGDASGAKEDGVPGGGRYTLPEIVLKIAVIVFLHAGLKETAAFFA